MTKNKNHGPLIARHSRELSSKGRLDQTKHFVQHGNTTVYQHVHSVADIAVKLNRMFRLQADEDQLIRAALLHDYFLYDWHDRDHLHKRPHGFHHPYTALNNARQDFDLHPTEENAIKRHMFPLIPIPPAHRIGWLVTLADKISTAKELKQYWKSRLLTRN